jgi:DDE domain
MHLQLRSDSSTVRRWCKKFGQSFANRLRRRRPRPGDKWHMDEVFIRIRGVQHYLWRAVDQDGVALDILVQARRDAESGRCNGSNRPSRPRASSLLTHSFMATAIHADTSWQPPPTAQSGPRHSMSGSRRRALSIRRDQ